MSYFHEQSPAAASPSFLPGYLLGSGNSPGSHARPFSSPSQEFGRGSSLSSKPLFLSPQLSSTSKRQEFATPSSRPSSQHDSLQRRLHSHSALNDKSGAPPTEGLFSRDTSPVKDASSTMSPTVSFKRKSEEIHDTDRGHPVASAYMTPGATTMDVCEDTIFSPRPNGLPQSPAQLDPFYSQCESLTSDDVLDACTATVFGFPPSGASYVLQQFSMYGTIIKKKIPNSGNWMHLQYQTKIQAKKALSKNGKIFPGDLMIGVKPCIEMDFLKGSAHNPGTPYFSHLDSPSTHAQTTTESSASPRPSTMRPLTAAYVASNSNKQVQGGSRTPQKQGGVVSKALDYMLGW